MGRRLGEQDMTGVVWPEAGDSGGKFLTLTAAFRVNVVFDRQVQGRAGLKKLRPCFGIGAGKEARCVHVGLANLRFAETGMAL